MLPKPGNLPSLCFLYTNVRMAVVGRKTARLMLSMSSRPDMNSREKGQRSHRSRIRPREAVSNRDGVIEKADQRKQSGEGHGLIPVIENRAERRLALHRADDGAEDDGHPQQRGKTSAEANAAKRSENDQNDHSQAKANERPGRFQFSL